MIFSFVLASRIGHGQSIIFFNLLCAVRHALNFFTKGIIPGPWTRRNKNVSFLCITSDTPLSGMHSHPVFCICHPEETGTVTKEPRFMKRKLFFLLAFLLFLPSLALAEGKNIHVYLALCDNIHQRIVPVPWRLGNGKDPDNNLYWGAMYGLKTYFKGKREWELVQARKNVDSIILERLVFRHKATGRFLVADAYTGHHIKKCLTDFLAAAVGNNPVSIPLEKKNIEAGGKAGLVLYVGHNGLMEFDLKSPSPPKDRKPREAAVLACQSKAYFKDMLKAMNVIPILLTTSNMAPEAYTVHALANAWLLGKKPAEIREAAAVAYNEYQKCGLKAARNLFRVDQELVPK